MYYEREVTKSAYELFVEVYCVMIYRRGNGKADYKQMASVYWYVSDYIVDLWRVPRAEELLNELVLQLNNYESTNNQIYCAIRRNVADNEQDGRYLDKQVVVGS